MFSEDSLLYKAYKGDHEKLRMLKLLEHMNVKVEILANDIFSQNKNFLKWMVDWVYNCEEQCGYCYDICYTTTDMCFYLRELKGCNSDWLYGDGWSKIKKLMEYVPEYCIGSFNFFIRDGFIDLLLEYYKRKYAK